MTAQITRTNPRKSVCAFDFDGTLSPIVGDRSLAALHPACRELLLELIDDPSNTVAVISNRHLEDLVSRLAMTKLILMASGGLVWRTEDGKLHEPSIDAQNRRDHARDRLIPLVRSLQRFPGIEIEDKTWSMAVHFRNVPPEFRAELISSLESIRAATTVQLRYGPEAAELPFVHRTDKGVALSRLARKFERQFGTPRMMYAGDDQSDLPALRYALSCGGFAFVVGELIELPQAHRVPEPGSLPAAVRSVMGKETNDD